MQYKHLTSQTNSIMEQDLRKKLAWVIKDHFVYYPKARRCLDELKMVYTLAGASVTDLPTDQSAVTVIGDSGTGKTSIIRQFMELHATPPHPVHERYHVAYCLLRDAITGLSGLYSSLLAGFGHPYGNAALVKKENIRVSQLEDTLLYLLKTSEVRVFVVDEFQHARGKNQRTFLNQLKRTMLDARVPFIPVGTPDVINVLAFDDQLPDRCPVKEYTVLDYWSYGKEFRTFLSSYERFLPFPNPSELAAKDLAQKIFDKVKYPPSADVNKALRPLCKMERANKTNLRKLVTFLKRVAITALQQHFDHIPEEIIVATSP